MTVTQVVKTAGDSYRVTWPCYYCFQVMLHHYAPELMTRPADERVGKSVLRDLLYVLVGYCRGATVDGD